MTAQIPQARQRFSTGTLMQVVAFLFLLGVLLAPIFGKVAVMLWFAAGVGVLSWFVRIIGQALWGEL